MHSLSSPGKVEVQESAPRNTCAGVRSLQGRGRGMGLGSRGEKRCLLWHSELWSQERGHAEQEKFLLHVPESPALSGHRTETQWPGRFLSGYSSSSGTPK